MAAMFYRLFEADSILQHFRVISEPLTIQLTCNLALDTIRYDTIRQTIFMCAQKLTNSQLSLPHRTKKQE